MGKIRMKKSAGPDEISQECLLLGKSVLAGPLTTIITMPQLKLLVLLPYIEPREKSLEF